MEKIKLNNGKEIYVHGGEDYISRVIKKERNYFEYALLSKLKKIGFYDNVEGIIEIGANVGNHILFYNNELKGVKTIMAFEPLPQNIEILKKNATKNVSINEFGVGEKNEKAKFWVNKLNYGNSSLNLDVSQKEWLEETEVLIKDIRKLKFGKWDLMKIDIEGGEKSILKHLPSLFKKGQKLMIELRKEDYGIHENYMKQIKGLVSNGFKPLLIDRADFIFIFNGEKNILTKKQERLIGLASKKRIRSLYDRSAMSKKDLLNLRKDFKSIKYYSFSTALVWSKLFRLFTNKKAKQ